MKQHLYLTEKKMSNTPRVEALISRVMARFPGQTEQSDRKYYPAVHQELGPLARELEIETIKLQARIDELETWQRTICELLAPEGDNVLPEDAHDVVSCLRETLAGEEERHANLQERCFGQGGQSVFDEVKQLRSELQTAKPDEATRDRTMDAVSEAIGDAYDCTRAWSAWGMGTMGPDDFVSITSDPSRVAEITDAAIAAMLRTEHSGVATGLRLISVNENSEEFRAACSAAYEESKSGTGPCGVFIAGFRKLISTDGQEGGAA